MIYEDDLEGRTCNTDPQDQIPELVPGTPEYDEVLFDGFYEEGRVASRRLSRTAEQLRKPLEKLGMEKANALYLLDNPDDGDPNPHIQKAWSAYAEAEREARWAARTVPGISMETVESRLEEMKQGIESMEALTTEKSPKTSSSERIAAD